MGMLHSILDFEHSRNQRQCPELPTLIGLNVGICIRKVKL